MTTDEQVCAENTSEEDLLQQAAEELAQVQARIGPRFRRAEARKRAGRFLQGLLAPVERKNGWQLAEELGERGKRLWFPPSILCRSACRVCPPSPMSTGSGCAPCWSRRSRSAAAGRQNGA